VPVHSPDRRPGQSLAHCGRSDPGYTHIVYDEHEVRLLQYRFSFGWFSKMSRYVKCFENVNGTTPKIYNFILQFHNTNFSILFHCCLWDEMKLINSNASFYQILLTKHFTPSFI
jgi:hypothetical protein